MTPEKYASFLSKMVFFWFDSICWKGWKTILTESDMWTLQKVNRCRGIVPVWDKYWDKHEDKAKKAHPKVRIFLEYNVQPVQH